LDDKGGTMTKAERREIELCVIDVLSYIHFKTAKQIREEVNVILERQEMPSATLTEVRKALSKVEEENRLRKRKSTDSFAYYN
jgi:hypothetical protein